MAISAELEGPSRAKSIQIMFNMAINYYSEKISGANADENDKEYLTILKAITIENDKNNLAIKYELPKSAMQELIKKKLSRVWSRIS